MLSRQAAEPGRPLIVCIPGSGYDERYFDIPGWSFLTMLGDRGTGAVAITRPGYPADEHSARHRPSFAQSAELLDTVVADIWSRVGDVIDGVVLLGHSVGGAVALNLAARQPLWPLLGVAVSGVGDRPANAAVRHFAGIPAHQPIAMTFDSVRPMFYGPVGTFDESLVPAFADSLVVMPAGDPVEVNTAWPADLPGVAASVGVPVFHAFAEFERLWQTGDERMAAFAAMFTNAPFVESYVIAACGHNIEHHHAATGYADLVSAFATRCRRP